MKFVSTRGQSPPLDFSQAVLESLAPDGGLYVPEYFPNFQGLNQLNPLKSLPALGSKILSQFLKNEPREEELREICERAFNFPLAMPFIAKQSAVLELFHGPTAAFKDFGARFLAEWFTGQELGLRPTVLVATSGDTGGAVASAFFKKPGLEVIILFPKGKVSLRQQKQLVCWGENIKAYAVQGDFDDCQRLVKNALADSEIRQSRTLLSANSINLGRLLPQTIYYAAAGLEYFQKTGKVPGFIVPSGNLGNSVAALYAMKMGFPIRQVVLATNANSSITQFFRSGNWMPNVTVPTLANAMDVGNPSNIERLRALFPEMSELQKQVQAFSVVDTEIKSTIQKGVAKWGQVWCPHTATAVNVREQLGGDDWIIVATAHPAKFETIIEPLIGRLLEVPTPLLALLEKPDRFLELGNEYSEFKRELFSI